MSTERVKAGAESCQPIEALTESAQVVDNQAGDLRVSVGTKVDDALKANERVDLGIDWDSLDKESLFASMQTFDDAENLYPKVPGNRQDTYIIYTGELTTRTGEKLTLEVSKVISPNFHELQIGIIRPSIEAARPEYRYVAGFDFLQLSGDKSEEWDMKHRQTSEPYKNQGIAGKVIELTEEILKKRSSKNNLAQAISAKSGQRDLTTWLEKRNFMADSRQDLEMLQRLKDTDSDLQDVTVNGETYTFNAKEFKLKFPKLSGPEDPAVWDFDNYEKQFFYMKSCFKIKMKKRM
jgi:hypothetical protein